MRNVPGACSDEAFNEFISVAIAFLGGKKNVRHDLNHAIEIFLAWEIVWARLLELPRGECGCHELLGLSFLSGCHVGGRRKFQKS